MNELEYLQMLSFLEERGALDAFHENEEREREKGFGVNEFNSIIAAFGWGATKQRHVFWSKLHQEFLIYKKEVLSVGKLDDFLKEINYI